MKKILVILIVMFTAGCAGMGSMRGSGSSGSSGAGMDDPYNPNFSPIYFERMDSSFQPYFGG